jgi:hypothetical protein
MVSLAPSPKTTLVVLLGASAWPRHPELDASKAFLNSYTDLRDYLLGPNGFDLPKDHLLDLFDSDDFADQLDEKISLFLKSHIAERKTGDVRDVLVYFIGHGEIAAGTSDFYLAIRRTRQVNPKGSSIEIDNLAQTLKEQARFQRRFLVLDCCFAASAVSHFQGSNLTSFITAKTAEVFAEGGKGDGFPSRGTTLLCSSRNTVRSRILPDETATMFTQALLHTLRVGTPYQRENLSLYTVHRLTEDYLRQMYYDKAPRPEVHSPDQSEGDVAHIPFFPNPRAQQEQAGQAEEERHRLTEEAEWTRRMEEERLRRVEEERERKAKEELRIKKEATLNDDELFVLAYIMTDPQATTRGVWLYPLHQQLTYRGYTEVQATSILAGLEDKGIIKYIDVLTDDGLEGRKTKAPVYKITSKGRRFIQQNKEVIPNIKDTYKYLIRL